MVQDEKEMAEMFNKFFNSMFTKENTDNVPGPTTAAWWRNVGRCQDHYKKGGREN